jgi:hypothetical protein
MSTLYFESDAPDDVRRARIYDGDVYVYAPRPSTLAFTEFARGLIDEAFAPYDPREAQFELPVEKFVDIVAPLQPHFIHHPESKRLIAAILDDFGCDADLTYFDVPRMRVQAHGGYLTAGVGYQLHPHRDTWYAAPQSQVNWWLPVFPIDRESTFAFFPKYFHEPVRNDSDRFDMYEWNAKSRKNAAKEVHKDTRWQPTAQEELDLAAEFRVVCPAGGLIIFSGAQLHATVPNSSGSTRFSLDFRTVHTDDVVEQRGAPGHDSHGRGTTLRAHLRARDLERLPEEMAQIYDPAPPDDAILVYTPES